MIKVSSLKLNPGNPRQIRGERLDLLKRSITEFERMMTLRPIIVDEKNVVLGGNMRFQAIKALGKKEIPDDWIKRADDLTDAQKREFIIKDNAGFGEWDWELLANEWDDLPLADWGVDIPDFTAIDEPAQEERDAEPQIDKAAELNKKWGVETGDLWQIGEHRLLCGDSTKQEDVERVIEYRRAEVVFTDPPYGVSIKGGALSSQTIEGDLTQTAIPFAFELAVNNATTDDARFYFCGAEGNITLYGKLFDRYLRRLPRHLIWVKESFVMKPNNYHYQYEMIFFGFKEGGGGLNKWFSGRSEKEASDVWQISRKTDGMYHHPTQKPITLAMRAIKNSCSLSGSVYEPFGGGGTTLVACQNLNRKCYAVEISPNYCAVILERMQTAFPELEIKRISTENG